MLIECIAGSPAPVAASVIHTDFGKAFIKAEVASFEDYKSLCILLIIIW